MVDVTNEIMSYVKTAVGSTVDVLSEYPSSTPKFPCVVFNEFSNVSHTETIDSSGEKYSDVSLQIDIFSNTQDKISVVKDLRNKIDTVLAGTYRMTRAFSGTTPNYADTNIYRYTLRYNFLVDNTKKIYRR